MERNAEIDRLVKEIRSGARVVSVSGLTSIPAKAFILSKVGIETGKTFVMITDSNKEAETWETDLRFWSEERITENGKLITENRTTETQFSVLRSQFSVTVLPSFESDVYSGVSPHAETLEKRALTLWGLSQGEADFVIVPARSLITRTISPAEMKDLGAHLHLDGDFPPEELVEKLAASGYVREDPISGVGQFSLRGGIVDVWSPDAESPVRIEFFGDTVDSIRAFDAETQLSTAQLKEISIAPMREFAARSSDFTDWSFFAEERFGEESFARNLKDRVDFAGEGETFSGWEFLFPLVRPLGSTVFEYIRDPVFVVDEPLIVEQNLAAYYDSLKKQYRETDRIRRHRTRTERVISRG